MTRTDPIAPPPRPTLPATERDDALALMREALALLDRAGSNIAAATLALAIDRAGARC